MKERPGLSRGFCENVDILVWPTQTLLSSPWPREFPRRAGPRSRSLLSVCIIIFHCPARLYTKPSNLNINHRITGACLTSWVNCPWSPAQHPLPAAHQPTTSDTNNHNDQEGFLQLNIYLSIVAVIKHLSRATG